METIEMVGRPTKTARTMTASERSKRRTFKLQAQAHLAQVLMSGLFGERYTDDHHALYFYTCGHFRSWMEITIYDGIHKLDLTTEEAEELLREILPENQSINELIGEAVAANRKNNGVRT